MRETRGLTTRAVVFYKSQRRKCQRPSSARATSWKRVRGRDPPRGETVTRRTWPLFRPTARPDRAGASAAIVAVVSRQVGDGRRSSRRARIWWRGCTLGGNFFWRLWVTCPRVKSIFRVCGWWECARGTPPRKVWRGLGKAWAHYHKEREGAEVKGDARLGTINPTAGRLLGRDPVNFSVPFPSLTVVMHRSLQKQKYGIFLYTML